MPFPYTFPIFFGEDVGHFIEAPSVQSLRVLVWDNYNKTTLLDDFTDDFTGLSFSTSLHGGFSRCAIKVPMNLERIWLYMDRENLPGRHFAHVEILEELYVAWEGRVMVVGFDPSGTSLALTIEASGYWGSCRDQLYDPADAGHTDWTSGSNHFADEIIAEMLTSKCPDISSDQANMDSPGLELAGIDLTARDYPQNIIVSKIPMTSDGTDQWFFAIWEGRKPYLKQRVATTLHWTTYTSELGAGSSLQQDAYQLRNNILPVKDGVEGTAAADSGRRSTVPVRDLALSIQKGVPTAALNEERDRALAEKKLPQQSQRFIVTGRVWSTKADGAFIGTPLWRVRAGEVVRIADLVPATVATPTLDALRTFYINETTYDAITNKLTIVPDRPPTDMTRLVTRSIQTELDR
mgnify:CR=1 FL=1|jgi:hypothetical protein